MKARYREDATGHLYLRVSSHTPYFPYLSLSLILSRSSLSPIFWRPVSTPLVSILPNNSGGGGGGGIEREEKKALLLLPPRLDPVIQPVII
jgi:hypothetical protein